MNPEILIIAGPNGAGKTTFARTFLPGEAHCLHFINADLIAVGLSPFAPEQIAFKAGRLMLQEIESAVQRKESFAFETTLSGRTYAQSIPQWQEQGYRVRLVFLMLANVQIAFERVQVRVRQGGHDIPESVIRRRYAAGLRNFSHFYRPIVDAWAKYDNSGTVPLLLDWGEKE